MTIRRSLHAISVICLLLGAIPSVAVADPVTLPITSGFLGYPIFDDARLEVQFPHGSANIHWSVGFTELWLPDYFDQCCTAGMPLNLSTDEKFPDPDGVHFGELRFGSDIYSVTSFKFSAIALRDIIVGEPYFFPGIPFTFSGEISGITPDHRTLALSLIGFGHATAVLDLLEPPRSEIAFVNYDLENTPSPVPEPGTWLLVATGLGAVMRRMGKNLKE